MGVPLRKTDAGPVLVHDGRHAQVLHFPGTSDITLITFAVMYARADGRNAFASKLADRHGFDIIGIVPKGPNWYPAAEMAVIAPMVRARLDRPALAYGASMGGYGALRYGRACGAQAALAFSPQAHIDPGVTGAGDPRYGRHHDPALHADMTIRAAHLPDRAFALFDPDVDPDLAQASLLPRSVAWVPLRHMGHKSAGAIVGSAVARAAFAAAMAGDAATLGRVLMRNARKAPIFHANLSLAATARGHAGWGLSIAERAEGTFGAVSELVTARATALAALGRTMQAAEAHESLIARFPHVPKFYTALARLHEETGNLPAAGRTLMRLAQVVPNLPLTIKALRALIRADRWDEARALRAEAAARWPDAALPPV
jgi:hypothetical protein